MTDAALLDETVAHLRRLIQFDTSNPPGNELAAANYLRTTLEKAGIETRLVEPVAGRGALIARIRGNGAAQPILVAAHLDVVGVERERWSVDPFAGETRDGYVYGRGAIDDKGMLAVNLMAMLRLKRELVDRGTALDRDVIFAATPDEETGGQYGLGWLIEHHPELIRAEFALNEGGRIRVVNGRPLYAAVQTTEKTANVVAVTARGPAGHASIPLEGNAVARLARAVAAIVAHESPIRLLPTVREFFARLAVVWPDEEVADAMADVASEDATAIARGCHALSRLPVYNAVLRTGLSPTIMRAGERANVIPTEGVATFSVRTLPGDSIDDLIERLRAIVDDPFVDIALRSRGTDAPASDHQSIMFSAIRDAVTALDPEIVTVPYMSTGATESAHLRAWGVQTFGLLPFPLAPADEARMHGHDERVPVSALGFGVDLVFDIVRRMAMPAAWPERPTD